MKVKRAIGLFMAVLLIFTLITGCGNAKKEDTATTSYSEAVQKYGVTQSVAPSEMGEAGVAEDQAMNGSAESPQKPTALASTDMQIESISNIILSQRKVIRNAVLSIEVEDFNAAYAELNSIISAFGYIQEANISKDKRYVDSKPTYITRGTIVIRVDRDKFDSILRNIYGLGEVMDQSITTEDVTDKFFDTESRLRLLKYEQSRLEEYLKNITDPDIIFKTESRLTEIRHEIESLTGTLNKWNSLVQLSTITLNMSEKYPESTSEIKERSYLDRLGSRFVSNVKQVVAFCGDILIFIVEILPGLILLGLVVLVIYFTIRKVTGRRVKVKEKNLEKNDNDGAI